VPQLLLLWQLTGAKSREFNHYYTMSRKYLREIAVNLPSGGRLALMVGRSGGRHDPFG
jgi:hypothetical protein